MSAYEARVPIGPGDVAARVRALRRDDRFVGSDRLRRRPRRRVRARGVRRRLVRAARRRDDVDALRAYFTGDRAAGAPSRPRRLPRRRRGARDRARRSRTPGGRSRSQCRARRWSRAVEWEIFDDLLIGNFMTATLHGPWPSSRLYPGFTPWVTKYADNGRARTDAELRAVLRRVPASARAHHVAAQLARAARQGLRAARLVGRLAGVPRARRATAGSRARPDRRRASGRARRTSRAGV